MTDRRQLGERYRQVRAVTERLTAPLSAEDALLQSADFVSPAKWHLAHTTWFFEVFILEELARAYRPVDERYRVLFNSYYQRIGEQHPRVERGHLSRPTLEEVREYRRAVDGRMLEMIDALDAARFEVLASRAILGLNHEQQHQELILMDVKHAFSRNPLHPVYRDRALPQDAPPELRFVEHPAGLVEIGFAGGGFAFDNESPRHRVFLAPYALASRTVTNAEYLAFIEDGGYLRPELWLSDGFTAVQTQKWDAPEYWRTLEGQRFEFTLAGLKPLDPERPVVHLSFFEADAYARWAGARLPTEAEWEHAAASCPIDQGNFLDEEEYHPMPSRGDGLFGDVWEHTSSAYLPYPGYRPLPGALGEYNGKFMSNQMVLRGGACVTPRDHLRASYRNFFYPHQRWAFSGLRLAKDLS